jgi:hypothetical protein
LRVASKGIQSRTTPLRGLLTSLTLQRAAGKLSGMTEETENTPEVDAALKHLEAAIDRLEGRLDGLFERLDGHRSKEREADALRMDRARLAGDLDAAKARERELQRLADEASEALGAAISEVREALGKV